MNLRRAAEQSTIVRLWGHFRDRLASRFEPVTRRLAAVDRALLQVVHGSWLYAWFMAESAPDPIVIDLRETYTVGPLLSVLDRVSRVVGASRVARIAGDATGRVAAAPARAVGAILCLAFSASLLATVATAALTWPVYLFHALGLGAGLVAFREHRDAAALAEAPIWSTLLAVFAPPPAPDDGD